MQFALIQKQNGILNFELMLDKKIWSMVTKRQPADAAKAPWHTSTMRQGGSEAEIPRSEGRSLDEVLLLSRLNVMDFQHQQCHQVSKNMIYKLMVCSL